MITIHPWSSLGQTLVATLVSYQHADDPGSPGTFVQFNHAVFHFVKADENLASMSLLVAADLFCGKKNGRCGSAMNCRRSKIYNSLIGWRIKATKVHTMEAVWN